MTILALDGSLFGFFDAIIQKRLYYQIILKICRERPFFLCKFTINEKNYLTIFNIDLYSNNKEMKTQKSTQYTNNASGNLNKQQ